MILTAKAQATDLSYTINGKVFLSDEFAVGILSCSTDRAGAKNGEYHFLGHLNADEDSAIFITDQAFILGTHNGFLLLIDNGIARDLDSKSLNENLTAIFN